MILVDTAVWVEHLKSPNAVLSELLEAASVTLHPIVLAELTLGGLSPARLREMKDLPAPPVAESAEIQRLIELRLVGQRIGYSDVHLLASVLLAGGDTRLWTYDRSLRGLARAYGYSFD